MDIETPEDEINVVEVIVNVKAGNVSELQRLLDKHGKEQLHLQTSSYISGAGATMLHWACESGRVESLQFLLRQQIMDINTIDEQGATCLHWACGVRRICCSMSFYE